MESRIDSEIGSEREADEARARTAELLREIRRIEIQTSRLVTQHLAGSVS